MTPKVHFAPATKTAAKARVALIAPAGAGKSYTALLIARGLAGPEGRIAAIDTEHGSLSKYAGDLTTFDTLKLTSFAPENYIEAIQAAAAGNYDVLIIDSLSHAWAGKDGLLEFVDKVAQRSQSSNTFAAWREATPKHNALVEAILAAPLHVIATMRSKMEYVLEKDERTGRTVPRKVGLQPVQRDGLEYEFDVVADIGMNHTLSVSKSRVPALADAVIPKPGLALGEQLRSWLSEGSTPAAATPAEPPPVRVTVEIRGKSYQTAGIEKDALVQLWDLSRKVEKIEGKGAAKRLLETVTGKESSVELTADEGAAAITALIETLEEYEAGKADETDASEEHLHG